jgi:hypothetical protein
MLANWHNIGKLENNITDPNAIAIYIYIYINIIELNFPTIVQLTLSIFQLGVFSASTTCTINIFTCVMKWKNNYEFYLFPMDVYRLIKW